MKRKSWLFVIVQSQEEENLFGGYVTPKKC